MAGGRAPREPTKPASGGRAIVEMNRAASTSSKGSPRPETAGVYKGRPASIDAAKVRDLKKKGMGPSEIAKALKIGRASVYRVLGQPATGKRA
jgi:DNA invertase Pin-like site-specific DNA recombinase